MGKVWGSSSRGSIGLSTDQHGQTPAGYEAFSPAALPYRGIIVLLVVLLSGTQVVVDGQVSHLRSQKGFAARE